MSKTIKKIEWTNRLAKEADPPSGPVPQPRDEFQVFVAVVGTILGVLLLLAVVLT